MIKMLCFIILEIGEMYSRLVSAFLKLQPWVRGGQGYSKTNNGAFDLITCLGSSYKPVANLRKKEKCGMTKT